MGSHPPFRLTPLASPAPVSVPAPLAAPAPAPMSLSSLRTDSLMLPQMLDYLRNLEAWAEANKKDARRDSIKFWSLKGPAILVVSSSGLLATMHLPVAIPLIFGLIGGLCVALDGVLRPGILHKVHV